MASSVANRIPARALSRISPITNVPRPMLAQSCRQLRQSPKPSRCQYSSAASRSKSHRTIYFGGVVAAATALASGYYLAQKQDNTPEIHIKKNFAYENIGLFKPTSEDYQKVYNAIAKLLWVKDEYEDGSYGPVVLRLAWHASGTYDAATGTGGSNGATMRFSPEKTHGANNGLGNARDLLKPIKQQFPWISYSDLWTLGGVCAIQEMQGPVVPWRPGRSDRDVSYCTPDGRLPDGAKGQNHIRAIFGRMGFNDQEMVALSGAHALGRCHIDRSGFEGPWTFSPTVLTNDFYCLLMKEEWYIRDWNGNKQYQDKTSKSLIMLPTDMALLQDQEFKRYVVKYAEDADIFFKDFSDAVCKLFELGVPFDEGSERLEFMSLDEQEQTA